HQTIGASGYLSALCGAGTTVVALQNGVEHRQRLEPLIGGAGVRAEVLPAIVWVSAEGIGPGVVRVRTDVVPRFQVPAGAAADGLVELLAGGMVGVEPVGDFTTAVWRKLTTNAVSGLMAVTGRRSGIYQQDDVFELARRLAEECFAVARAEG